MSLSIEDPSVQRHDVVRREQKVKVLESLSEEEALLYVVVLWSHGVDIFEAGESILCSTPFLNCLDIDQYHVVSTTQHKGMSI